MASPSARTVRGAAAALAAAAVVMVLPAPAAAVPGEIVPTFAGDSTLTLPVGTREIVTDSQGRIVVAAAPQLSTEPVTVQRFTAEGAVDTSFSGDGQVTFLPSGSRVGGPRLLPQGEGFVIGVDTVSDGLHLWSIDEAGALVAGYGTNGLAIVPEPDGGPQVTTLLDAVPVGTGVGAVFKEGSTSYATILDASGDPLAPFADGPVPWSGEARNPVVGRASGGLLVAASGGLVPIGADGTVGAPVIGTAGVRDVEVDAQDRVLVTLTTDVEGAVARRFTSSLQPDPTFGTGGSVSLPGGNPTIWEAGNRRFLTTVQADAPDPDDQQYGYRGRVWVAALTDGGLDPGFGTDGVSVVQDVYSEDTPNFSRNPPVATLTAAPAGGVALGILHTWGEASLVGNWSVNTVRQLSGSGVVVGTYAPPVRTASMVDGGDDGATFLAIHGTYGAGGRSHLVRVELQQPGPPGAPATPVIASVDGASYLLTWTPAAGSPDRYTVSAWEPGAASAAATVSVDAPQLTAVITVPHTGRPYRFDVHASAGTAVGPRSAPTGFTLAPFTTAGGFIGQLHQDVPTWRPDASQRAQAAIALAQNGATENLLIEVAHDKGLMGAVDPVTRIYTAYFGRLPDSGGLRYWVGKRRAGMTVARISAQFAASSEFRRTYGSLSDRAFVALVYENVLGRSPDQAGLDYWTGRLASKRVSRGQLMANFSESSEHVRKLATRAYAVRTYWFLLGRAPRTAEVAPWVAPGASGIALIRGVLESPEYAGRVS